MNAIDRLSAAGILKGLSLPVHVVVARHMVERPDHPALVESDISCSYRAFADAIDTYVEDFRGLVIRPARLS